MNVGTLDTELNVILGGVKTKAQRETLQRLLTEERVSFEDVIGVVLAVSGSKQLSLQSAALSLLQKTLGHRPDEFQLVLLTDCLQ